MSDLTPFPAVPEAGITINPQSPENAPHQPHGLTRAQAEAQLHTLEAYAQAASEARSLGGPAAGLAALLRQPVRCGPFTLHPMTLSVFLFLKAIDSPLLSSGISNLDLEDICQALLAFTGPEQSAAFLRFTDAGITADKASVIRAGWQMSCSLNSADVAIATEWLTAQLAGVSAMVPAEEENTENFPTPPVTSPPPEAPLPAPALPAGSL